MRERILGIGLMGERKYGDFFLKSLTTVKPRFTGPRFTGSSGLPGLILFPQNQALCVNQHKFYPDLPGPPIYRA